MQEVNSTDALSTFYRHSCVPLEAESFSRLKSLKQEVFSTPLSTSPSARRRHRSRLQLRRVRAAVLVDVALPRRAQLGHAPGPWPRISGTPQRRADQSRWRVRISRFPTPPTTARALAGARGGGAARGPRRRELERRLTAPDPPPPDWDALDASGVARQRLEFTEGRWVETRPR
jgi:hypothetical protein